MQLSGFSDVARGEAVRRVQDAVHAAGGRVLGARSPAGGAMVWVLELNAAAAGALAAALAAAGLRLTDESTGLLRASGSPGEAPLPLEAELNVLFLDPAGPGR